MNKISSFFLSLFVSFSFFGKAQDFEVSPVIMNFNVAYKQFAGNSDSLLLVYSPDCGATWLPTGYAKGGAGLSTSTGTTTASFLPTGAEWRAEKVVLKDFCKNNLKQIMIGFQSYNDHGNNIYVDGIQITGFASAQRNIVLNTCISSTKPSASPIFISSPTL